MKAPHDRIQKLAGAFEADLYEVCGNLYGFASDPSNMVEQCRQDRHGLRLHSRYDRCVMVKRDDKGFLLVVMIIHVDDFLVTFREDYP